MPIFEYKCTNCKQIIEVIKTMKDLKDEKCPDCNSLMKKIISNTNWHWG